MHAFSMPLLLAQVSVQDVQMEMARLQRNYEFLSYGLTAAWVILVIYVLLLVSRQRKLRREISSLRAMLEDQQK
jgi:CcmD family protein